MFVGSFPDSTGKVPPNPLIRIMIVAVGPIVWNAAILFVLFLLSLALGPMLNSCCNKFGSAMASIAHGLAVVGMLGFFEFLVCCCFDSCGFLRLTFSLAHSGSWKDGMRLTLYLV